MITVAILGILAAIAIPQYSEYVTRGRIPPAVAGLADARIKMEQFFQDNRTYPVDGCVVAPTVASATQIQVQAPANFALTCTGVAATTYTITATGSATMAGFVYTIDQANIRTSSFSTALIAKGWANKTDCWSTGKGLC